MYACVYSRDGLLTAFKEEPAFRQELFLYLILLVPLYFLPLTLWLKLLLLTANSLVLIVEVINTAIEAVVDLVSLEFSEHGRNAKDMGSAAVALSLMLASILWLCAIGSLLI